MNKFQEIKRDILDVMHEFGYKNYNKVAVEIYGKLVYLTEAQIRALQVIAARKAQESEEAYQEFCQNVIIYNGPHKGRAKDKSHKIITLRRDGIPIKPFESGFMDLCDNMAMYLFGFRAALKAKENEKEL